MLLLATYRLVVSRLGEARRCLAGAAEVVAWHSVARCLAGASHDQHTSVGTRMAGACWGGGG